MGSPEKASTPEGEKLQVELASKMFDEGSAVKESTREGFMASNRRDERSQLMARVGGESAKVSREQLVSNRSQGEFQTVSSGVDVSSAGIAATGTGGRSYETEGDIVRSDTSSTERVARSMAAQGQKRSMDEFTESNGKKQALIDTALASGMAYAYSDNKKVNDSEIAGEVSIFSQQSASNGMSTDRYS